MKSGIEEKEAEAHRSMCLMASKRIPGGGEE